MSAIALYARATAGFDDRVAATLRRLRDAATAHAGRIVQSTSLGAEDMVVTDLIARHQLPITVATLETGALHPETVALIGTITQHYGLPVAQYKPQADAVVQFVRRHGDQACTRAWTCARPAAASARWNRWAACWPAAPPG